MFYLAEIDWLDIFTKITMTVMGCAMLTLGGVAYYKVVVKGNGKKKDDATATATALLELVTVLKRTNDSGNGSCPNTQNIAAIKDVTLRDRTPLEMNLRNIEGERRIKNIETASVATAQHQLDMRRVAQEQSRLMNKGCSKEELKFANMKTGQFPKVDLEPVKDD